MNELEIARRLDEEIEVLRKKLSEAENDRKLYSRILERIGVPDKTPQKSKEEPLGLRFPVTPSRAAGRIRKAYISKTALEPN